jgi:serine/threonine-protein kinase
MERIGRGPRTESWRATAPGANEEVAFRVVRPEVADRPEFLTLFEKETSALTALSHPNILPTNLRGRSGGKYFFTQSLARDGSLRDAIRRGVPPERALHISLAICDALEYAHRRGLPHRHLVAENVFLTRLQNVLVADFGLSLLTAASSATGDLLAERRICADPLKISIATNALACRLARNARWRSPRRLVL